MHNAKRMVLVYEKLLDYKPMLQHFQGKQDLSWKRQTEQSIKSTISKQMKSTLNDPAIPDDVKAKHYRQSLNRFLQSKRKLIEEPAVDELLDSTPEEKKLTKVPTIDELLDIQPTKEENEKEARTDQEEARTIRGHRMG
jgi:hypothetical protein